MAPAELLLSISEAPTILAELCRRFHVQTLEVFGSAATGAGFDVAHSDIDLLVRFEALEPGDYAHAYFGLHQALEALTGRSVDLLSEQALENPYLRRRVDAERRLLFPIP
jgi:predicted nucleotidyltransferase